MFDPQHAFLEIARKGEQTQWKLVKQETGRLRTDSDMAGREGAIVHCRNSEIANSLEHFGIAWA